VLAVLGVVTVVAVLGAFVGRAPGPAASPAPASVDIALESLDGVAVTAPEEALVALAGVSAASLGTVVVLDRDAAAVVSAPGWEGPWLAGAVVQAACEVESVSVLREGQWAVYIVGAPAAVNGELTSMAAGDVPAVVRCAEVPGAGGGAPTPP
jgi:hypothetical protein